MTKLIHRIVHIDGTIEERPFTAEELMLFAKDAADLQKENEKQAELIAKREAAESKLAALGLTSDDLKALGLA